MSDQKLVPVVGLIGGVGSGKSSVARRLAQQMKLAVVNGDEIGHAVLKSSAVKQKIHQRFGEAVFDGNGEVGRSLLGSMVFGTTNSQKQALADLEEIVHPEIRKSIQIQIEKLKASNVYEAIILDAAVMIEAGWDDLCDAVVFVDTPLNKRLERVGKKRGWNQTELNLRESSQLSLDSKREVACDVIDNSNNLDDAATELKRIIHHLQSNPPRK